MNKKYQVFVSSTKIDLTEERQQIMQALLESKCIPVGMEFFPSANKKSWEFIKQDIDESDFYLLVIAGKYGSTTKNDEGKTVSYTEKEYDYAVSINKPIMVFMHKDTGKLPSSKVEETKKGKQLLEKFRKKILESGIQTSFWLNTGNLISEIKSSIQSLIYNFPSAGWVKGTEIDASGVDRLFLNKIKSINEWGLEKIFRTRAEKNSESDPLLEKHNVKVLDGIAFGLRSFRTNRKDDVLKCLQNGMKMRLITMNPESDFVKQREIEERVSPGSISSSIYDLITWANELNSQSSKGKIEVKCYNAMTLDFYWRIDNNVYVGPYLYDIISQQTITAKFCKGGKGYKMYTHYFDSLWNNANLCKYPKNFIKS